MWRNGNRRLFVDIRQLENVRNGPNLKCTREGAPVQNGGDQETSSHPGKKYNHGAEDILTADAIFLSAIFLTDRVRFTLRGSTWNAQEKARWQDTGETAGPGDVFAHGEEILS